MLADTGMSLDTRREDHFRCDSHSDALSHMQHSNSKAPERHCLGTTYTHTSPVNGIISPPVAPLMPTATARHLAGSVLLRFLQLWYATRNSASSSLANYRDSNVSVTHDLFE